MIINPYAFGASAPSAYTALNPAATGAGLALSGGNLVATQSTSGGISRSVAAITGKRYFESVFTQSTAASGATIAAGVVNGSHGLTESLGFANANGWGFWGRTGYGARHNGVTAIMAEGLSGVVLGFAVDADAGKMWIRRNGVWMQGDPATGTSPIWSNLSGTLYAAAGPWASASVVTMRFDPAQFSATAPSGFSPIEA